MQNILLRYENIHIVFKSNKIDTVILNHAGFVIKATYSSI